MLRERFRTALSGYRYARCRGKIQSEKSDLPVDSDGQPIPWLPYPTIDYLDAILDPAWSILEYGAGHSSYWLAERVNQVTSVEHNREWYESLAKGQPQNLRFVLAWEEWYVEAADEYGPFDVAIIDGIQREACLRHVLEMGEWKLIVHDDIQRLPSEAEKAVIDSGYNQMRLNGLRPLGVKPSPTAIFLPDPDELAWASYRQRYGADSHA